jgi:hypothetical protein
MNVQGICANACLAYDAHIYSSLCLCVCMCVCGWVDTGQVAAEKKTIEKQLGDLKRLVGCASGQHDTHDSHYIGKQQRDQFISELIGVLDEYSILKQEFMAKLNSS